MQISTTLLTMSFFAFAGLTATAAVEVGAPAPDVVSSGAPVRFAELYKAGLTLVYFYPKADTPGCTAQACSLRDSFAGLKARGVRVIGVSGDNADAQKKFREKHELPFTLVADADGKVARAFGVPSFLGFTKRQSFLVKEGKVVWRDLSVSPKTHVAEVNKALDGLQ